MSGIKACVLAVGLLLAPAATVAVANSTATAGKPSDNKKAKKKAAKKANKGAKKADPTAALFKKLDTNSDGKLSQTEFAKLKDAQTALKGNKAKNANKAQKVNKANKAKKGNKKADATAALFKKLDTNNDGSLTAAEFGKLKETQKALQAANPNKKNKAKK